MIGVENRSSHYEQFVSFHSGSKLRLLISTTSATTLNYDIHHPSLAIAAGLLYYVHEVIQMGKYSYHDDKRGVWIFTNDEGKKLAVSDMVFNSPESEKKEVVKGVRKALGLDENSILESIEKSVE